MSIHKFHFFRENVNSTGQKENGHLRGGDDAVSAFVFLHPCIHGLRKLGKGHETARAEKNSYFPHVALQAFIERVQRKTGAAFRGLEQTVVEAYKTLGEELPY